MKTTGWIWKMAAIPAICFGLFACSQPAARPPAYALTEGDVLFQSLPHEPLVDTIEGSTQSPFSHCGILHQTGAGWVVIEAIGPVKETPLEAWIAQGREGHYSAFRLKPQYREKIPAFIQAAQGFKGRPYDIHYDLDDSAIYCSELIFKAFRHAAGEDLGKLQTLGQLRWEPFKHVILYIEGGKLPLNRLMITPRSLSEASQLEKVFPR